jgi:hypothetical protein
MVARELQFNAEPALLQNGRANIKKQVYDVGMDIE